MSAKKATSTEEVVSTEETNTEGTVQMNHETPSTAALDSTVVDSELEAAAEPVPAVVRPRIRSGAIAWGLIVCAISTTVLVTVSTPQGRTGFLNWAVGIGPAGQALVLVLALGGFIVLLAGLSLIRRAQRRLAPKRS